MEFPTNQNINFGRIIIDNINLRKKGFNGNYKLTSAIVSKLEPGNIKDIKLLNSIKENWRVETTFSNEIIDRFLKYVKAASTYIIELKNGCFGVKNKVCAMIDTTNPEIQKSRDFFMINYIQSAPVIADNFQGAKIKGAGELCVYEAVKTAQKRRI